VLSIIQQLNSIPNNQLLKVKSSSNRGPTKRNLTTIRAHVKIILQMIIAAKQVTQQEVAIRLNIEQACAYHVLKKMCDKEIIKKVKIGNKPNSPVKFELIDLDNDIDAILEEHYS